jgi:hypothetical protein
MKNEIENQWLLSALSKGVKRSGDLIAQITDYHGGPVTTEYMLTSDIARELIEQNYEVEVEYLNRRMITGLTMRKSGVRKKFGSRRTDIAVLMSKVVPLAIIEVKIGVKTLNKIKGDLLKITDTIRSLKPQFAARVRGAVVFQVHVAGSVSRLHVRQLNHAVKKIEKSLRTSLRAYKKAHADFRFTLYPLQSGDEGIVATELEPDGNGLAWGREGHATRYYAVLVRSKQRAGGAPLTFRQLKAQSSN